MRASASSRIPVLSTHRHAWSVCPQSLPHAASLPFRRFALKKHGNKLAGWTLCHLTQFSVFLALTMTRPQKQAPPECGACPHADGIRASPRPAEGAGRPASHHSSTSSLGPALRSALEICVRSAVRVSDDRARRVSRLTPRERVLWVTRASNLVCSPLRRFGETAGVAAAPPPGTEQGSWS